MRFTVLLWIVLLAAGAPADGPPAESEEVPKFWDVMYPIGGESFLRIVISLNADKDADTTYCVTGIAYGATRSASELEQEARSGNDHALEALRCRPIMLAVGITDALEKYVAVVEDTQKEQPKKDSPEKAPGDKPTISLSTEEAVASLSPLF